MVIVKSVLVVGKSKSGKIESDEFAVLNTDTELMVTASYDSNIQLSETGAAAPDNDKRNVSATNDITIFGIDLTDRATAHQSRVL